MRSRLDIPLEFQGEIASLSKNVSQSGILCRTSRKIDEFTLLDLKFQLPTGREYTASRTWIECRGVVVRCEMKEPEPADLPYEVAIFFNSISKKNRDLLANFIDDDN